MKNLKLFTVLLITFYTAFLNFAQQSFKIQEQAVLDSNLSNFIYSRQSLISDANNVLHIFYGLKGTTVDYIIERKSTDNGITWSKPDTVSVHNHPTISIRYHLHYPSAVADEQNNIHLIYRYDGKPNYISGWDDYPSSHINYVTKINGQWQTEVNIVDDYNVQQREGNTTTVCYLNDYQLIDFKNHQHLIAYDYAWWATKYHIIYSNNLSGSWLKGDTLRTYNLGSIDNIVINAPAFTVNNDTLFALWYNRKNCRVEMKYFDGTNWSPLKVVFNDKLFSIGNNISTRVSVGSCQNKKEAHVVMYRNPQNVYSELIVLNKYPDEPWNADTVRLSRSYYSVTPVINGDTLLVFLYDSQSRSYSVVKYANGNFSSETPVIAGNLKSPVYNIQSTGVATEAVVYTSFDSTNQKYYLRIGKLNVNSVTPSGRIYPPQITNIFDVPNDNGKHVYITWKASPSEKDPSNPVVKYSIWRKDSTWWTFAGEVPARLTKTYTAIVRTIYDSTKIRGMFFSVFQITAHGVLPSQLATSAPDSGYSLDNLSPHTPDSVKAIANSGVIALKWAKSPDADLQYYAIYRDTVSNFNPESETPYKLVSTNKFTDISVEMGKVYYYKIAAVDFSGNRSGFSRTVYALVTDVNDVKNIPKDYILYQNYPNPFNPTTEIKFAIPKAGFVKIVIFNSLGQKVQTILNKFCKAGSYGIKWNAGNIPSGIYYYRLISNNFVETKKMVLLK